MRALGVVKLYRITQNQLTLEDFIFEYGTLNQNDEWIQLSYLMPWAKIEKKYAQNFINNGNPAHNVRIAVGALIVQQKLKCSDENLVTFISQNPYLQYFIGMKEYTYSCPFGASTLVAFRKRITPEMLAEINEMIIPENESGPDDGENGGTLILDATCVPADISFPQDIRLLNDARVKTEQIIDELHRKRNDRKPRTYRKKARKAYLKISKSKKRSGKMVRTGIKQQLQYLLRNLSNIAGMVATGSQLSTNNVRVLTIVSELYRQQKEMYDEKKHNIADRIVNLFQPHIRPVVRGKAKAKTEFGAKLHISMTNGYTRIERVEYDVFNEAMDFTAILERYKERNERYPERVLADRIYRNRENIAYCKSRGIKMSGPALGRPKKDVRTDKKQEYQDICERNAVEGKFGEGKKAYGLDRVSSRLKQTSLCVISVAILAMNLSKRLRSLFVYFSNWVISMFRNAYRFV